MEEDLKKKVDTVVALSRLAGGMLIIIGCILVFVFVQAALDPKAVIEINDVSTSNQNDKILAVIFCSMFPIVGALLSFLPNKHLDKLVEKIVTSLS